MLVIMAIMIIIVMNYSVKASVLELKTFLSIVSCLLLFPPSAQTKPFA